MAAMATTKKVVEDMKVEIEKIKEEVKREEGREEENVSKARAENNQEAWSRYGEWKGLLQAKREEAKKLEKKKTTSRR